MHSSQTTAKPGKPDPAMRDWHHALSNPASAQEQVLQGLVRTYGETEYGRAMGADGVGSYADFVRAFPVQDYAALKQQIDRVLAGDTAAMLSEEPLAFALTKGTTGKSKLFPWTPSHARLTAQWYARIVHGQIRDAGTDNWLSGYRLNLVPSSILGTMRVGTRDLEYGFSMAVGMRLMETSGGTVERLIPSRAEMDALPKEPSKENWERRFETSYQRARHENVTYVVTTPNIAVGFGRYLVRAHGIAPKDVWPIQFFMSTGFPGTYTRYASQIRELYGRQTDIREGYVGTEACYGAQLDTKKAWSPMYDHLFFEVQTIRGIKPMYEMSPGEIGSLIVSTPDYVRYQLRDLILAYDAPYFRCIGREFTELQPFHYGPLSGKSILRLSRERKPRYK